MRTYSLTLATGLGGCLTLGVLAAGARPADDAWGTIKGQIVYAAGEEIPPSPQVKVTTNQDHCLAKGSILDPQWTVNKGNRGVKNVFLWLAVEPNGPVKTLPIHPSLQEIPKQPVVVDQPQCMFEPRAVLLREGQDLIVKNSSPISHNANYGGSVKNRGNNVIVPPGKEAVVKLNADRFPVPLSCNIHPWMKGFIAVHDHPYHTLTDENGNFEIKLAPAGNFRLFIWHEDKGWRLGVDGAKGEPVTIKAGGTTDLGKLDIKKP
jgi:hypothetical protein